MIRSFVALDLPATLRSALAVQQFLLPLPHKVPVENLHLTLVFLGEQPDAVLEAVHEAFQALRCPGFDLELSGLGLFGGDRPTSAHAAAVPDEPLMHLQRKLFTAARRAGADLPARRFVPHVALGRFAPPPPEEQMRLERAVAMQGGFRAGPVRMTEFVLYRSTLARGGSRHDELARYPLAPPGAAIPA
jgi:RNA 2',3'-cyclic 3'-phosphodiesterase